MVRILSYITQYFFVKLFFFIDFDADGRHKQRHRIKLTKIRRIYETCQIFFGGDDDFLLSRELPKLFKDVSDVVFIVGMVVGIFQCFHPLVATFQLFLQCLWAGDAAE